jgi:transcriptional regulator with XRE-family HTH domain
MKTTGTFGQRLRWARSHTGLSAAVLSQRAGLAASHVGLLERGDVEWPTTRVAVALALMFGVSLDWLLIGVGEDPSPEAIREAIARTEPASVALNTKEGE